MPVRIQFRRGISSEWTTANPILAEGEIGLESDNRKFKIGDGATAWASLPYIDTLPVDYNQDANVILGLSSFF
jgi:hypothetical protein